MSRIWAVVCGVFTLIASHAASLREASFTQVVNDVKVAAPGQAQSRPAAVEQVFKTPEVLRTGPGSLAELRAPDQTLTRVGANTVFAFEGDGRNIRLEKGSILFHSPKGKGGGTIKSGGASAAVLGTTLLVIATEDGGFKAIVLEGRGRVTLPNGMSQVLNEGQMIFVPRGASTFGPVLNVDLKRMVEGSKLVKGFEDELPSMPKIAKAMASQARLIRLGRAEATDLLIGKASGKKVQLIDASARETAFRRKNDHETPGGGSRFQLAIRRDATFTPEIDSLHVFSEAELVNVPGVGEYELLGIAARNLTLPAGFIGIPLNHPKFDFLAAGDLIIEGSIGFFSGMHDPGAGIFDLYLSALGSIVAPEDTELLLHSPGNLHLRSRQDMVFTDMTITVPQGDLFLNSDSLIWLDLADYSANNQRIQAEAFEATSSFLAALNHLDIFTGQGGIDIANSSLKAGELRMATRGNLTLTDVDVQANFADLTGDNVKILDTHFESQSSGNTARSLVLRAHNELTLDHVSFSGLSLLSMEAHTLVLKNVDFAAGSSVHLRSEFGQLAPNPNTEQDKVMGKVNFINNVTYGGSPAQNFVADENHIDRPIRISGRN